LWFHLVVSISQPAHLQYIDCSPPCRFFAELLLNGVFDREGMQLLGTVLSFLVQTDRQEHVNVSVLLPFCRSALPAITGIVPASVAAAATAQQKQIEREQFLSTVRLSI
jgi:regulator of nonsense transcripts 2